VTRARRDYERTVGLLQDATGVSYREAQGLWRDLRDALGYRPGPEDVIDYLEVVEALLPAPAPTPRRRGRERFALEGPGDAWIEPGEEMELTATYKR
jgi:hypothetical protein